MQDSTLPFVCLLHLGKTEESDLLPVWSDRQGLQDGPRLSHFPQTRTWQSRYSLCTFCKSHFYLHFVAFVASLALPLCFARTPGNYWECQTSHLLWPTPFSFFTTEMAPACCRNRAQLFFSSTLHQAWAELGYSEKASAVGCSVHLCCEWVQRRRRSDALWSETSYSSEFLLWRMQKGWAILPSARGNHLRRAGSMFTEAEK